MLTVALFLVMAAPVEKPTVVMIHGAGGGGWEYRFWQQELKRAGYKTLAPDLMPVKGGLAKTIFNDYVDQVVKLGQKEKRVILVGASMGGPIALKASEKLKAEAIVLINSVPPKGTPGWKRSTKTVPDVIKWANGPMKDTEDSMPDSFKSTILWAHKLWRNESGPVVRSLYRGVECKKPTCPVLVIIGRKDTDIKPSISRSLALNYNADILEYSGMSHVGPLLGKRSREVAKATISWLGNRSFGSAKPPKNPPVSRL